jgi:hypothetical protein
MIAGVSDAGHEKLLLVKEKHFFMAGVICTRKNLILNQ